MTRCEVRVTGGFRLLLILASFLVLAAAVWAEDAASPGTPNAPPKVKVAPVEETLYGHKIVDNYRWLEDANSAETKEYVAQEMAYSRGILDLLPGREKIHDRLLQLA
jgi:prolyl oligopeptidase